MDSHELEQATADELAQWSTLGSLPTWLTGQHGTKKAVIPVDMMDPIDELRRLEQQWCQEADQWKAPGQTIPAPPFRMPPLLLGLLFRSQEVW